MNIRRVLAVAAIPFVIGTFGFVNQANAQSLSHRNPVIAQQVNRPHQQLPRHNQKLQLRRTKPQLQNKKRPPQFRHQAPVQNQLRPIHR